MTKKLQFYLKREYDNAKEAFMDNNEVTIEFTTKRKVVVWLFAIIFYSYDTRSNTLGEDLV